MKFELSFANKEITPWGVKQMLDKIGFKEQVFSCDSLPAQSSIVPMMWA